MKRAVSLFLFLFVLALFHFSFANTSPGIADPLQQHTFSSPEQTWEHFKAAILEGDFETAHKCCCQDKSRGVLRFELMDAEKRKNIVESMGPIEKVEEQENTAMYKVPRTFAGKSFSTYVNFEKVKDEWKIKSF